MHSCSNWICLQGWDRVHQLCPGRRYLALGWVPALAQEAGVAQDLPVQGFLEACVEDLERR